MAGKQEDTGLAHNAATISGRIGVALALALVGLVRTAHADIINVPVDQPTIQAGVDAAFDGDEVVLADGTYTGAGNKFVDFSGKAITVRSAGGPDGCVIDLEYDGRAFSFISGEGPGSVLDGVIITRGLDVGFDGALYILNSSPTISNCVFDGNLIGAIVVSNGNPTVTACQFVNNQSQFHGGAIHVHGAPTITYCDFIGNAAVNPILSDAGAIYIRGDGLIDHCNFIDNYAGREGGAILTELGVTVSNCTFVANTVGGPAEPSNGGAMVLNAGTTDVVNCLFARNTASQWGGALYIKEGSSSIIINSTFHGNASVFFGGAIANDMGNTQVSNSVMTGNSPQQIGNLLGDVVVVYSNVAGGYPGVGNINADPLYVDSATDNYRLSPESPCIDAASNPAVPGTVTLDLDDLPRFLNDGDTADTGVGPAPIVDMGPYEYGPDCNDNGVRDDVDILEGTSEDCNANGAPDECEVDCNLNDIPDECDIADGTSQDCNGNGVPDFCDLGNGTSQDCNFTDIPDECEDDCNDNGLADECDIDDGTSQDCNDDDIPDECQDDCNDNGFADECDLADGTSEDCNVNALPDECDIADGTSQDCNADGVPDECGADCNANGLADECDIADGTSQDCNSNDIPDECDIADGTSPDCNVNGVPDQCDIDDGTSQDCNVNTIPDECDIADGTSPDCNVNGVPDQCDIDDGTSDDCNGNGVPDDCDADCNDNGAADDCDIADGLSNDCNGNAVPDECDDDCNSNGAPDDCDVADGTSPDCNANNLPDECDIADGTSQDCNATGIPDECETDCNDNGAADECDIADGTSQDCNANATPDECETDCNFNGAPDDCDLADGTSQDCNETGIPDECEDDCNDNGLADECDLADGTSRDANQDDYPDECVFLDCNGNDIHDSEDIDGGASPDCNGNLVPDECDADCNDNGSPDDCDVAGGGSEDCNANGFPDECDVDCNGNGSPDACDTADGTSDDCNDNDIPDDCELAGGLDMALSLQQLNLLGPEISYLVPNRFDFTGGVSSDDHFCDEINNNISDGGGDMFDCGNYLSTDLAAQFLYTDGAIVNADADFGPGSRYFTAKFPGVFLMVATDISIDTFETSGGNGADGNGFADEATFSIEVGGRQYTLFVKRISEAGTDPSINQIIIVPGDGAGISQTFSFDTDDGLHTVAGLGGVSELYYLLTARRSARRLDDADAIAVAEQFIQTLVIFGGDCNNTQNPDECDVIDGTSEDCDGNGLPDECDTDCNDNGVPDPCDVADGTSEDCNTNGIPDECDTDCNANNVPDDCDVADGTSEDCNTDGIPDECDAVEDCNANGVPDECDTDANANGVPDDCEFIDCNDNGTHDLDDLNNGTSDDCNGNFIPDECELTAGLDIDQLLLNLELNGPAISDLVPNRFDFEGGDAADNEFCGEVNNNISDGGNDMYDCANYLHTDLTAQILYTEGAIVDSDAEFGAGSRYFTAKYPGLFVMVATGISIDTFETSGNNGADGSGQVEQATFSTVVNSREYTLFVKRIFGAGNDPSINHIIMIPGDDAGISHTISFDTNEDVDTVSGLAGVSEVYYLLTARQSGLPLADDDVLAVAEGFLENFLVYVGDSDGNGVPDDCDGVEGPVIIDAKSLLLHGAGPGTELAIDLDDSNGIESRLGGPLTLAFEMDQDLDGATIVPGNVQINCATGPSPSVLATTLEGARTVVVDIDEMTNLDCCNFAFAGVQSTLGGAAVGTFNVRRIEGDVDFSGAVTGGDASIIKPHFGEIVGVDLNHPKWDFDRNGGVTGGDFSLIKPKFGDLGAACP